MAYTIVAAPKAWFAVTWDGVSPDGTIVENEIELLFTELRTDPAAALTREGVTLLEEVGEIEDGSIAAKMAAIVARMAGDWRGVAAENGEPLKWSAEHVEQLMTAAPGAFAGILAAYVRCLGGRPKAREGNSAPSRQDGPAGAAAEA